MSKIKIRDLTGMGPDCVNDHVIREKNTGPKGLYGQFIDECDRIPIWKKAGSEVVLEGMNNSMIVLGRDRSGHSGEGVGGMGGTGCGSIDMVVGLGSEDHIKYASKIHQKEKRMLQDNEKKRDPNFVLDAARLYITQKGEIDYYFGLAVGSERTGMAKYKSGAALKADHVRIIGREHVKIVAGKARFEGYGMMGERNAGGGANSAAGKIDLIAGNYTDASNVSLLGFISIPGEDVIEIGEVVDKLQPVPKGQNLLSLLDDVFQVLSDMSNAVLSNSKALSKVAYALGTHTHIATAPGAPVTPHCVTPSPTGVQGVDLVSIYKDVLVNVNTLTVCNFNLGITKLNYITPNQATFILSEHVNTT